MVQHTYWGVGPTLFQSGILVAGATTQVLYASPTEAGIRNSDGTFTYIYGSGFTYDYTNSGFPFQGGIVTSVKHFSATGVELDSLSNLTTTNGLNWLASLVNVLQGGVSGPDPAFFWQGNDVIDARYRLGNAVVNDVMHGYEGNDSLFGGSGNDKSYGDAGNDYVNGGTGSDLVVGGTGSDYLVGGDGNDTMIADMLVTGFRDHRYLTSSGDKLFGGNGNDILLGSRANDILNGGTGIDTVVFGGTFASLKITNWGNGFQVSSPMDGADDWLTGIERIATDDGIWQFNTATQAWSRISTTIGQRLVAASQQLNGTVGDDILTDGPNLSIVMGGDGNDSISLGNSGALAPVAFGGNGNDAFRSGYAAGRFHGGAGDDTLTMAPISGADGNFFSGGAGQDTVVYGAAVFSALNITKTAFGFNVTSGSAIDVYTGVERIKAGASTFEYNATTSTWVLVDGPPLTDPIIHGTSGDDVINSSDYPSTRTFFGDGGNDTITLSRLPTQSAVAPALTAHGGDGNDIITGPRGPDYGNPYRTSSTFQFGDAGDDTLMGGDLSDTLDGGTGSDVIEGGIGADTLTGGTGSDTFMFHTRGATASSTPSSGNDIITDFEVGIDRIGVSRNFPGSTTYILTDTAEGTSVYISDVGTIMLRGVHGITQDDLFV